MIKNYLKIALRNLQRHPGYTFINVFGLAIGIAFCALLLLYVNDELTYDDFHEHGDRLYRAQRVSFDPDGSSSKDVYLPMPLGPALQADFPDVEAVVRFCTFIEHFIRRGALTAEESVLYADPTLFNAFSFPLLRGNPDLALAAPHQAVLSERAAWRYFGEEDPMGQTLEVRLGDTFEAFTVTGVAKDPPSNSSVQFDILLPFVQLETASDWFRGAAGNWQRSAFITYVLLEEGSTLAEDADRLLAFRQKYYPGEETELRSSGEWEAEGPPVTYALQELSGVHLDTTVPGGISPASNPLYSYILLGIALVVLSIAFINFMTLTIGRSTSRAREVGVRKVVGAVRRQLMGQFWGETLLLSSFAGVAGLVLAAAFLPVFNTLTQKELAFDYAQNPVLLVFFTVLVLGSSLVAGAYPAVVLSGFRPVDILRNRFGLRSSGRLTGALVVVQFALSVFLIISTLIMLKQLEHLQSRDLGFDQEQVVVVHLNDVAPERVYSLMKEELEPRTDIEDIAAASLALGEGAGWMSSGFDYNGQYKQIYEYRITPNYLGMMEIDLVAGRNFDEDLASDTLRSAIVNEALVRDFGWEDPIGQVLNGYSLDPETNPVIIGVVEDYNFRSLHEEVAPMMLMAGSTTGPVRTLLVKTNTAQPLQTLEAIRASWESIAPDVPFQYNFMEEDIERFYAEEERWSQMIGYASLFAIVIACMGLLGLTALMVVRRTKEVGIRKVLGASVSSIVGLLSLDFLKLVGVSVLIAAPAAFFTMQQWLQEFAYRVDLGPGVFLLAGVLAAAVAFLTISYYAIKAAIANPVRALRAE